MDIVFESGDFFETNIIIFMHYKKTTEWSYFTFIQALLDIRLSEARIELVLIMI